MQDVVSSRRILACITPKPLRGYEKCLGSCNNPQGLFGGYRGLKILSNGSPDQSAAWPYQPWSSAEFAQDISCPCPVIAPMPNDTVQGLTDNTIRGLIQDVLSSRRTLRVLPLSLWEVMKNAWDRVITPRAFSGDTKGLRLLLEVTPACWSSLQLVLWTGGSQWWLFY